MKPWDRYRERAGDTPADPEKMDWMIRTGRIANRRAINPYTKRPWQERDLFVTKYIRQDEEFKAARAKVGSAAIRPPHVLHETAHYLCSMVIAGIDRRSPVADKDAASAWDYFKDRASMINKELGAQNYCQGKCVQDRMNCWLCGTMARLSFRDSA